MMVALRELAAPGQEEWSRAAKHALAKQRLRLAARHEALNAQVAKRWQRALDAALAGRATTW